MILRRCHPITIAKASPTPADDQTTRGHAAFEAKQYLEAWHAYKAALLLDPGPSRASHAAIAAPFAARMSAAFDDLRQWLVLKRDDARRCGDLDESWNALESIVDSFEASARRSEQDQATQRIEIERLEQQLTLLKDTLQRMKHETQRRFRKPTVPDRKG